MIMKKQIIMSVSVIAAVAAVAVGGTMALFSDTETSNGNIFTAGSIDLKVDHTYASYNGQECDHCTPTGGELLTNGGFEDPNLSTGQWHVYSSILGWTGFGAGIEVQDHAAGNPNSGDNLVELDSHGPNSSSAMEQTIVTVPGQKYRLEFYHSPRPNNGPDTDNAIELSVLVTSPIGIILTEVIGSPSSSDSGTVWTKYTRDFVALTTQTTIRFADAGSEQDTLGGYLDDVSVKMLDCPTDQYTDGGTCTLWGEKDLTQGDVFWNFTDVKPGDRGTNVISLHVYSNDAYVCLYPTNIRDDENGVVDPELTALPTPDNNLLGVPNGELSGELEFFVWNDKDNNGIFDPATEDVLVDAGTPFRTMQNVMIPLALASPAPIDFIGMTWCAGDQTGPTTTLDTPAVSCDGNGMGNIAQTDKVIADFVATAVQQRNNSGFTCGGLIEEDREH